LCEWRPVAATVPHRSLAQGEVMQLPLVRRATRCAVTPMRSSH
jgi:hypothetical protein